jgi:hypothetical protein
MAACSGRNGAVVELADEMDGTVEGVEVAMSMIADIHLVPAGGAVTVEDVKLPEGEVGILWPVMRHGVDLRVVSDSLRVVLEAGQEDTRGTRRFLAPCLVVEKMQRIRGNVYLCWS